MMSANLPLISADFQPGYLDLQRSGQLRQRAKKLWRVMEHCALCPRLCGANRLEGQSGDCGADSQLVVSAYNAHFGEEEPLVGYGGSGTIFLTHCSLRCSFCQNWDISHEGQGQQVPVSALSGMMLQLQNAGCHNINLVSPGHFAPHILLALDQAAEQGLKLPVVYNTNGWERQEILKFLDGVVDIYLADFKYWDSDLAARYSAGADSYPRVTRQALLEMQRQVGVAKPGRDGIMYRGLMIRHLVMPDNVSGSIEVMQWISENLPADTYINIMSQYRPAYRAVGDPVLGRRISREEYSTVVQAARRLGLTNLEIQGYPL